MAHQYMKTFLGVPRLGILTEYYDFDDEVDKETLDLNIANGCSLLSFKPVTKKGIQKC